MKKILVVGSINTDLVLEMPRMPERGESLLCKQHFYSVGGKGSNAAVAAARLGAKTAFSGQLGDDAQGENLRRCLVAEGVDDSRLITLTDCASGLAVIFLEDDGYNRIAVYAQANMVEREKGWTEKLGDDWDAVMLQLEIPVQAVIDTVLWAMDKKIPVVLDAGPAQDFPLEKIRGLDILSPNETETQALCGVLPDSEESAKEACRLLRERSGAKNIVLKMGDKGCMADNGTECRMIPAFKISPVDTTAAGDSFTGAMTLRFLECGDLFEAARFGNAAGALTALGKGAMPSLPTRDKVEQFLKERG